jgi:hypothetical protein
MIATEGTPGNEGMPATAQTLSTIGISTAILKKQQDTNKTGISASAGMPAVAMMPTTVKMPAIVTTPPLSNNSRNNNKRRVLWEKFVFICKKA